MEVKPVRQKPVKIKEPQTIAPVPTIINNDNSDDHSSVGEKIVVKTVVYESDSDDPLKEGKGTTRTFTNVKLYEEDSSDSENSGGDLVPTRKKKKKKKKMDELTETVNDIKNEISETFGVNGTLVVDGFFKTIAKGIAKSRILKIILVIGTIFIGVGYVLKIIYK